jgi:Protein of unknown function (DUF2865)
MGAPPAFRTAGQVRASSAISQELEPIGCRTTPRQDRNLSDQKALSGRVSGAGPKTRREEFELSAHASRSRISRNCALLTALSVAGMALAAETATAQGLFDFLFGGGAQRARPPGPPVQAYAPPTGSPGRYDDERRSSGTGQYTAYCVRLCDGRYFPIQRESGNPAQLCQSFCPTAQTKIFSGSGIDYARADDGQRYERLQNAFLYRDKVVPDCTCNGKDPFGLVRIDPKEDPTLRQGDVIATREGLMAYSGPRSRSAEFTPVQAYSGMSKDMRKKLSETKILQTPEPKRPPPVATVGQSSRDKPHRSRRSRTSR